MKSVENDDVLNGAFQDELKKIPAIFRLNKVSIGIAIGIEVVLLIFLTCACNFMKNRGAGILDGVVNLAEYFVVLLFTAIPMFVVVLWFIIGYVMEKKAFRKASAFAYSHSRWSEATTKKEYAEMLTEIKAQEREMEREREQEAVRNNRFCPKCGLLLMPGDEVCGFCGKEVE